jgi:Methyltransferase domain
MLKTGILLMALLPWRLLAQDGVGDVVYKSTPQPVVEEMLRMARVGPKDFVIDLGSGDGRVIITAAKKFGAHGLGVDLDKVLLKESNDSAQREGVADRVRFIEQNLFETDLSQATVIMTYLLPGLNQRLRPKILNLKPGTRVITHDYDMIEWHPDQKKKVPVPGKREGYQDLSRICMWTVPAKVAGRWEESQAPSGTASWEFEFKQSFQEFKGVARQSNEESRLTATTLEGDQISFMFFTKPGDNPTRHEFKGTVKDHQLQGTLTSGIGASQKQQPLSVTLVERGDLTTFQSPAPQPP